MYTSVADPDLQIRGGGGGHQDPEIRGQSKNNGGRALRAPPLDPPLHIDYQRKNYGKFSVKYRGAKLWNNLPENLRNQKSYGRLKKMIKKYIQYHLQCIISFIKQLFAEGEVNIVQ